MDNNSLFLNIQILYLLYTNKDHLIAEYVRLLSNSRKKIQLYFKTYQ